MIGNHLYPSHPLEAQRRQRLAHLSKKLYRASTKCKLESTLYFAEARLFAWFCGQPWAQRRYWPEKVEAAHTFLRETKLLDHNPSLTVNDVVQQMIFVDYFSKHWFPRVKSWPAHQRDRVITVDGWERWLTAYQQKKGVILTHYHALGNRLILFWLATAGVQGITSINAMDTFAKETGLTVTQANTPFLYARQLHTAKACLETGGVVRILPDGFAGKAAIAIPFYQRTRSFRTAFAELALLTNAPVIPVAAVLDLRGRIVITFHPPLAVGDSSQPRAERIEQLVKQYVAFLHTQWANWPGNISPGHLARHLAQSDLV